MVKDGFTTDKGKGPGQDQIILSTGGEQGLAYDDIGVIIESRICHAENVKTIKAFLKLNLRQYSL